MSTKRNLGIDLAEKGNYEEALALFLSAYEDGDLAAINDAGVVYERTKEFEKAKECYMTFASLGNEVSMYNLANFYRNGIAVNRNPLFAAKLYLKAARKGYSEGYFKLAEMLLYGEGLKVNVKKAFEYLKQGYKLEKQNGNSDCTVELGCYYEFGRAVKKSERMAAKYYKEAAEKNCATAMYNLAYSYKRKKNAKRYANEIVKLFNKAIEQDYPDAYAGLAYLYIEGDIVEKDMEFYEYLIQKSIEKKSLKGMLLRAWDCFSGELGSVRIEEGKDLIALYIASDYKFKSDYDYLYQSVKNDYPDIIDWEALESDPLGLENINKSHEC